MSSAPLLESLAQDRDVTRKVVLLDDGVWPDETEKIVFLDDGAVPLDQYRQDLKVFGVSATALRRHNTAHGIERDGR